MIVFPTTEQVEVFANDLGSVTIRQEDCMGEDPAIIHIPIVHITAVIRALRQAKKDAEEE